MLDPKFVAENIKEVKRIIKVRGKGVDVAELNKLAKARSKTRVRVEKLRAEQNKLSKGANNKKPPADDIKRASEIKRELKNLEPQLKNIEKQLNTLLRQLPNLIHPDVPPGKDETENKVMRKWGKPTKFSFKPKDHLELGENLGVIDVETASEVAGSGFGYLKGDAALLEFALVQYAFSVLSDEKILKIIADKVSKGYNSKPFTPVVPPVMIRPDVMDKMARLEPKEERYHILGDDLYLVGSAEHTLGPMHMDEIIPEEELPIRYVGFSTSFRREAGSYGRDTRGILRVHQFDKIEIESFTTPENSVVEQDFIVGIQEYLMQSLKIPYQVIAICAGELGAPDYRQIDIEVWLPGQGRYRETHTSDLMTDYQARRLNTRFKGDSGTEFVHMNDATVFAIGRTIIAILENYQQKDGSVKVPAPLVPYVGKKIIRR